jgi:hypothetical protein
MLVDAPGGLGQPSHLVYTVLVSWPWIVLLACAVAVVVAAEWPRLERLVGADARRRRERDKRKAKLRVVADTDDDDFVRSVQRDLDALPTVEERESGPSGR